MKRLYRQHWYHRNMRNIVFSSNIESILCRAILPGSTLCESLGAQSSAGTQEVVGGTVVGGALVSTALHTGRVEG